MILIAKHLRKIKSVYALWIYSWRFAMQPGVAKRIGILFPLLLLLSCGKKTTTQQEEQRDAMLQKFFTVALKPGTPDGLWLADKDSVATMVEKKYLSSYVAKPDELQKDEIRKRLSGLTVLYRIEGNSIAMLTQVADSAGISAGTLRFNKKTGAQQVYDFRLRGKDGEVSGVLHYYPKEEKIEYIEGGFTIRAARELRPAAELITDFKQRIEQSTGLPRY